MNNKPEDGWGKGNIHGCDCQELRGRHIGHGDGDKEGGTGEDKLNGPALRGFQDQFFLLTGGL